MPKDSSLPSGRDLTLWAQIRGGRLVLVDGVLYKRVDGVTIASYPKQHAIWMIANEEVIPAGFTIEFIDPAAEDMYHPDNLQLAPSRLMKLSPDERKEIMERLAADSSPEEVRALAREYRVSVSYIRNIRKAFRRALAKGDREAEKMAEAAKDSWIDEDGMIDMDKV